LKIFMRAIPGSSLVGCNCGTPIPSMTSGSD